MIFSRTMDHFTHTLRIVIASVLAVLMIGGSYALSGPIPFFGDIRIANAENSAVLLREYAVKDSDSDGLFDWQESLYATDPHDAESFRAGIKDGDAVTQGLIQPKVKVAPEPSLGDISTVPGKDVAPDTITDQFAQALFKQYMLTRGDTQPTAEEIATFVEEGVQGISESNASRNAFSLSDMKSSGATGPAAMRAYIPVAQHAFDDNDITMAKDELSYFSDAMKGDAASYPKLKEISAAYARIARAFIKVPVPEEARVSHLAIANSLMHMSKVSADMAAMESDPLRALIGVAEYQQRQIEMLTGFSGLSALFVAQQIVLTPDEPGYDFYSTSLKASQTLIDLRAR